MKARSSRRLAVVVGLVFIVASLGACGGGGGDSYGPAGPSKLFVADSNHQAIGSLADSNPRPGSIAIDRIIAGPATGLGMFLQGLDYDPVADRLFVLTDDMAKQEVLVFDNASKADGNVAPRRLAALPSSPGSDALRALQFDAGRNQLYLVDSYGRVSVFANAGTGINATVSRTFADRTSGFATVSTGMALDPGRDSVYLLAGMSDPTIPGLPPLPLPPMSVITRFDNASGRSGDVVADKSVMLDGLAFRWAGLALDRSRDKLYAGLNGRISVLDDASGTLTVSRQIVLPGGGDQYKLAVDPIHDRLYASDGARLFVIPNASTATGTVAATALIAPAEGLLSALAVTP